MHDLASRLATDSSFSGYHVLSCYFLGITGTANKKEKWLESNTRIFFSKLQIAFEKNRVKQAGTELGQAQFSYPLVCCCCWA